MITIPQGGNIAGRAAQVQIEAPDIGGPIADFGNAISEKFGQIKAQQEAVKVERTKLDIVKEIGTERQRFDQMTDPTQIEAEWPVFVQGITDKYTNAKGPDGKPLLTPDQSAALGLTIQDMTTRHGLALGDQAIKLTQSQATAAWTEARLDIVNTAATADPDTMLAMIELGEGAIDQRLQAGIILPEQAATEKQALNYDVYNARAISIGSEDPAGLRADLEAGEYDPLGPERVAALKAAADADIARLAAAEAKAGEAAATEQDRIIKGKLADIAALAPKGVAIADLDLLNDPAFKAHPDYAKTVAAVDLARETPGLALKSPAELSDLLEAERARPKSEPYQAERELQLETMLDAATKGYATDAAKQAKASGLPIPELDPEDLEALPDRLAARIAFAGQMTKDGYVKHPSLAVLDETERAALKAMTAPEADFATKMDLANAIAKGTNGNPEAITRLIGADPVFAEATRALVDTGSTELATAMLRGQQKIATGTAVLPTKPNQVAVFDDVTGGAYDDDPAAKARILEATAALYADGARGLNPDGSDSIIPFMDDEDAKTAYTSAIQRVTGATPDRNGNLTVGGLQPLRDRMVALPPGVALEDVETAMDNLWFQINGEAYNPNMQAWESPPAAASPPDTMRALRAASADGRVPYFGEVDMADDDWLSTLQIEKVPGRNELYRFVYPVDGRSQIVGDREGIEYRFRMKDLIKGAQK